MAKEILQEDINQIEALTQKVLGTSQYAELERMGGLTNHTYKVTLNNGEQYVVRIPGLGTEEMIVRSDEMTSTKLACDLDIDAKMLYFGEKGDKVTEYIKNAQTMNSETLKTLSVSDRWQKFSKSFTPAVLIQRCLLKCLKWLQITKKSFATTMLKCMTITKKLKKSLCKSRQKLTVLSMQKKCLATTMPFVKTGLSATAECTLSTGNMPV